MYTGVWPPLWAEVLWNGSVTFTYNAFTGWYFLVGGPEKQNPSDIRLAQWVPRDVWAKVEDLAGPQPEREPVTFGPCKVYIPPWLESATFNYGWQPFRF